MNRSLASDSYQIQIGRRRYTFPTLRDISNAYSAARDSSGEGASTVPSAKVFDGAGNQIGHVSYNGKVWPGATWVPGIEPLFDPYEDSGQPLTAAEYFDLHGIDNFMQPAPGKAALR